MVAPRKTASEVQASGKKKSKSSSLDKMGLGLTGSGAGYQDPKTSKIEDWKWRQLSDVRKDMPIIEVPDYIQKHYGEFMNQQLARAQAGELSPRDLLKAFTITQSSIGRGGLPHSTATKTGMKLPNTGGQVRPEGAFAEWLGSPMGQKYLKAAERGEIDPSALKDIQEKFAPFGKQNQLTDQMTYAAQAMPGMAKKMNKAVTGSTGDYRDWAEQMKGIAGAKSGFVGSMIGRGDLPTLDARQLNLHTLPADVGIGSIMNRGKGLGAREAVDRLAARQAAMGLKIDPSMRPHYQHLAHHAVWDAMGNDKTTHEDIIKAMKGYEDGGSVKPDSQPMGGSMPTLAQMKLALSRGPTSIQNVGVNEAPGMQTKTYIPPASGDGVAPPAGGVQTPSGMPIGGIDTNQAQAGQQFMPQPLAQQQAGQPPQPGQPGQPGMPGQPGQQQPPQMGAQQPTPPAGNMLQMTQQGRALGAMGPAAGQQPQGMAEGGRASYQNAPKSLMGYKREGPQTPFHESKYPFVQYLRVHHGQNSHIDAMKGMNKPHALARAELNWPAATHIEPIGEEDALKHDPLTVKAVKGMAKGGSTKLIKSGSADDVGYLQSTPLKPHPLVGKRFVATPQGNLSDRQKFDISKYEGKGSIVPIPYDATTRDRLVTEVSGHKLRNPLLTEAGFDYSLDPSHMAQNIGGASNLGIAKRVQSRIDQAAREHDGDVFLMPNTMGEHAENFSHHPAHIVLDLLSQGRLNKKTMKALSDDLRNQPEVIKTPKGYVKIFPYKNFIGFEHPSLMEQVMKGGHGLETTSGNLRKKMMERLGLVGSQKLLNFNIEDLKSSILDPDLATDPKSYMGHTVVKAKPGAALRPSKHSSYDTDYAGLNVGGMGNRPLEIMMPDIYSEISKELSQRPAKKEKSSDQHRAQVVGAIEKRGERFAQPINSRVINNAGLYEEGLTQGSFDPKNVDSVLQYFKSKGGYKQGGKVQDQLSTDTMRAALILKKKAK